MILEFEAEDFVVFRDLEDSSTISIHKIEKLYPEDGAESFQEKINGRIAFFDLMGLKKQTELNFKKIDSNRVHLVKSEYDYQNIYSIEIWQESKLSNTVITASYSNLEEAQKKFETLQSDTTSSLLKTLLPRANANEKCALLGGPSLFEKPIREVMSSVEKSLDVACHVKEKTPQSAAEIAATASKSCLKGMAASPAEIIKFAYEILNFAFKSTFNSKYRSGVLSGMGSVAMSLIRDPSGFVSKIFSSVWQAASKEFKQFRDCSYAYKIRMTCRLLADMATGGLVLKAKTALKSSAVIAESVADAKILSRTGKAGKAAEANVAPKNAPKTNMAAAEAEFADAASTRALREQVADEITAPPSGSLSIPTEKNAAAIKAYSERVEKLRTLETEMKVAEREQEQFRDSLFKRNLDPDVDVLPKADAAKLKELDSRASKANREFSKTEKETLEELKKTLKQKGIKSQLVSAGSKSDQSYLQLDKLISAELRQQRIAENIESLSANGAPEVFLDMRRETLNKLKEQIRIDEAKMTAKRGSADAKRILDEFRKSQPSEQRSIQRVVQELTTPHLEITELPNTTVVKSIKDKLESRIVVSPRADYMNPSIAGSFAANKGSSSIRLNGGTILNYEDLTRSSTLLHEVRHAHFEKQRRLGKETPYNIQLTALDDKPLMDTSASYQKYFSFEELSTWERDSVYASKTNRNAEQIRRGAQVKKFAHEANRSLMIARMALTRPTALKAVQESERMYSVTIPLKYHEKSRSMTIRMMGKAPTSQAELKAKLDDYLVRATEAVEGHKTRMYGEDNQGRALFDAIFSSKSSAKKFMEIMFEQKK